MAFSDEEKYYFIIAMQNLYVKQLKYDSVHSYYKGETEAKWKTINALQNVQTIKQIVTSWVNLLMKKFPTA